MQLQTEIDAKPQSCLATKPLLGFVLSIKDSIIYKDADCSYGLFSNINHPFKKTAKLIKYLEKQGALVSCKGNLPQYAMSLESSNEVFGNVSNPWDNKRTAGGSTGGDAALIASG